MARGFEILLLVILLGAFGFSAHILWTNMHSREAIYQEYKSNESQDYGYLNNMSHQFYPNMRYKSNKISYNIEASCDEKKREEVERAFNILSEKTILEFYPANGKGDIVVLCSELPKEKETEEKDHFIAGEGGASEVVNATVFAIILEGKIYIYRDEKCEKPNVAIHEILHALGFDHNNNTRSILYPVSNCEQEIDSYLIDDINRLYSIESEPDLAIESITANRSGRYLNYVIKIGNYGLKESKNATLKIYGEDEEIMRYDLGEIELGMKRILTAQNIRLKRDYDSIRFVVELKKGENDLNLMNNFAEIAVLEQAN